MKLNIETKNAYEIDMILDKFQEKLEVRMMSYDYLKKGVDIAESILDGLLKKQSRQNICAVVKPKYERFKPEYPYIPVHTECHIRRGRKGWYITSIVRAKAHRGGSSRVEIIRESLNSKHDEIINFVTKDLKRN
jgi:hypothetical protein